MSRDEDATGSTQKSVALADPDHTLEIGDTLTVVSGRLGGVWMVEDDDGIVYMAEAVE